MPEAGPAIEVEELRHQFDGREVLKGIDLTVQRGEILAVMGSSGGGKTTLLKCISGLLKPTKGDVRVEGVSVVREHDRAVQHIGLVFQYAALFDFLSVRDNVLFGVRRNRRISKKDEEALLAKLLAQVHLEGVENQKPAELSGGMRKRVGLARALAMDPAVLLYDEPTSGLDPVTAYSIDRLIVETRDQRGATSVVVSHDVNSVLRVADRIAFLHGGELAFWGTKEEFRVCQAEPVLELVRKSQSREFASED